MHISVPNNMAATQTVEFIDVTAPYMYRQTKLFIGLNLNAYSSVTDTSAKIGETGNSFDNVTERVYLRCTRSVTVAVG